MQGSIYPDIVEELSNKAPTFAFWGWKKFWYQLFQDAWELMEGVMLTGLLEKETKMIISMFVCAVQELVLMT